MGSERAQSLSETAYFQDGARYIEGGEMFTVGDLVRVIYWACVTTHPIMHYAEEEQAGNQSCCGVSFLIVYSHMNIAQ